MGFKFEDLRVWDRAVKLSARVDGLTNNFPKSEMFVLSSQIKRAADSVALNIAEGSTGQSVKEFKRFLTIAIRSGIEVISCLYVGRERKIINEQEFEDYYND